MHSIVYFRRIGDISDFAVRLLADPRRAFGNRSIARLAQRIPELRSALESRMDRLDIPPPVSPQVHYSESRALFHHSPLMAGGGIEPPATDL
jgi:hypothetical protein